MAVHWGIVATNKDTMLLRHIFDVRYRFDSRHKLMVRKWVWSYQKLDPTEW